MKCAASNAFSSKYTFLVNFVVLNFDIFCHSSKRGKWMSHGGKENPFTGLDKP